MHVFTLVHYEMTGVIINARCIARLESRKGAHFQRKTDERARACERASERTSGFEAGAYQRIYNTTYDDLRVKFS